MAQFSDELLEVLNKNNWDVHQTFAKRAVGPVTISVYPDGLWALDVVCKDGNIERNGNEGTAIRAYMKVVTLQSEILKELVHA